MSWWFLLLTISSVTGLNKRDLFYSVARIELEVGICQASCLSHFPNGSPEECHEDQHFCECWATCQMIHKDPEQVHKCFQAETCGDTCQIACASLFSVTSNEGSEGLPVEPEVTFMFPRKPIFDNCSLHWDQPGPLANQVDLPGAVPDPPKFFLYVLFIQDLHGKWHLAGKTSQIFTTFPPNLLANAKLIRLVAVSEAKIEDDTTLKVPTISGDICHSKRNLPKRSRWITSKHSPDHGGTLTWISSAIFALLGLVSILSWLTWQSSSKANIRSPRSTLVPLTSLSGSLGQSELGQVPSLIAISKNGC